MQQQPRPEDNPIPETPWNMFPQKGHYLRNIMRFSGYETIDSIPKLRSKEERGKLFEFVKSVSEIIESKDKVLLKAVLQEKNVEKGS